MSVSEGLFVPFLREGHSLIIPDNLEPEFIPGSLASSVVEEVIAMSDNVALDNSGG